ncbi:MULTISPECIES: ALF repeat-containing protein [Streptomyces]|uniref:ALF repeat-containing protein n=1 Tax=Streptomyces TaxID=1883 RepID=UPI000B9EE90F|nr:ALF repeat-containing protein [Streptomyces kasugaensis]
MKLSRISAAVAAAAIAPAVLFSSPAVAADGDRSPAHSAPDRAPDAKPDKAAQGTASSVVDDRVAVSQILSDKNSGPGVREAAEKALDGTAEDVRRFLEVGQYEARAIDNRVRVAQIINFGGPEVRAAGIKALRGTREDIRNFLEAGQYEARAKDKAAEEAAKNKPAPVKSHDGGTDKKTEQGQKGETGQKSEQDRPDRKDERDKDGRTGEKPAAGGDRRGSGGADAAEPAAVASPNAVAPAGGSTELASTGAGSATPWVIGGAAVALGAGAGLVVAARRRSATGR